MCVCVRERDRETERENIEIFLILGQFYTEPSLEQCLICNVVSSELYSILKGNKK